MIEKEKRPNLTYAEEKTYLNKFFEYAKFYSGTKSELYKNKKETEDNSRSSFE